MIALRRSSTLRPLLVSSAFALAVGACNFGASMQSFGNAAGIQMPQNAQEKTLLPSQVHQAFTPMDAANPFAAPATRVQYLETGMANYDTFFLNATRAQGSLVLARDTLRMANETLNSGIVDQALSGEVLAQAVGSEVNLNQQQRNQVFMALVTGNFNGARRVVPALNDTGAQNIRENLLNSHPNLRHLQAYLPASVEALTALPTTATQLTSSGQSLVNTAQTDFAGPNAVLLPRILTELRSTTSMLAEMPSTSVEILNELRALVPGL